jgi:multidrug efflux pump subunit AcrB
MMGLAMIVGSITEVGVFYCSELFSRSEAGHRDDDAPARLLAAGIGRLRPIAMTTIAATLAMMPLAIGLGEGASMLRPLAIAIVSGLLVQLPLVLLVLPVVLSLTRATHRRRRGHEGAALHAGPQGSH